MDVGTNVSGSRNAKRWQDPEELRVAGIDVVGSTAGGLKFVRGILLGKSAIQELKRSSS